MLSRVLFSFALLLSLPATAQLKGIHDDLAGLRVIVDVDLASGAIPPEYNTCVNPPAPLNQLYASFTVGLAYSDDASDTLYGIEWDNGGSGPDIYLHTIADNFCAVGTRVGALPVGFVEMQSLAYCATDGFLYSQTFNFGSHLGQLVRIDPVTGAGTAVGGAQPFDVRIMGMACDAGGTLWAVTAGHGSLLPELYTVNPNTGVASLVGATGTPSLSLLSLALDGGTLVAGGTAVHHLSMSTGAATLQGGSYNSLWSMSIPVPEPASALGFVAGVPLLLALRRRRTRRG